MLSSLIQFVSNLCYGTGKFRTLLRSENSNDFFGTLKTLLISVGEPEEDKEKNTDRIVLKQSMLAFIGNLCMDSLLRSSIASNNQGLLEEVYNQFDKDYKEKKALWQDVLVRELAVFVNVSIEASGLTFLLNTKPILPILDSLLTSL